MKELPDFRIGAKGRISGVFLENGIYTFSQAVEFIRQLPYGRNADKNELATIFRDGCGTCSTKHAILKQLADEHGCSGLRLMLGLFRMNGRNTPEISAILEEAGLDYIPEAHNYLKYRDRVFDLTAPGWERADFIHELIGEMEIMPGQISDFKVAYHKEYLQGWLTSDEAPDMSLHDLWELRERCIAGLSAEMQKKYRV